MTSQYDKAIAEVNETFNFYMSMLAERKLDVVKELDKLYSSKQVALSVFGQKVHDSSDKIEQIVGFIEKLIQSASTKDILMFQASLESKMSQLILGLPQLDLASTVQLEFISNFQAIQVGVRNQFGYIKSGSSENTTTTITKQPPIARPISTVSTSMSSVFSQLSNSVMSGLAAVSSTNPSGGQVNKDVVSTIASSLDLQNNVYMSGYQDQKSSLSSSPLDFLESLTSIVPASSSPPTLGLTESVSSPILSLTLDFHRLPWQLQFHPLPSPIHPRPRSDVRR